MSSADPLRQPTTLRVFLYMRTSKEKEHGVRQTQKTLGFKSPNSVTWHFNKLREAGLIDKTLQNMYYLTEEGMAISEFEIPYSVTVRLAGSYLLPKFALLLSFLITAILVALTIFLFVREPLYLAFTGIVVSFIALCIITYEFVSFRRQLSNLNGL